MIFQLSNLSQSDKLSLFKLLAVQIPDAELQAIFSASKYPVRSPYDATESASILMQMIRVDSPEERLRQRTVSTHRPIEFSFSDDEELRPIEKSIILL